MERTLKTLKVVFVRFYKRQGFRNTSSDRVSCTFCHRLFTIHAN